MLRGQALMKRGGIPIWIIIRRLVFIFLFFFVNRFVLFFLYSVLPSSLLNARLRFHVIHPHLIIQHKVSFSSRFISFFLLKKKKKKLSSFTCDLLLSLRISDLKCGQAKNSQVNGSLRENVSVFLIAPSSQKKCRYERTFKEINRLA